LRRLKAIAGAEASGDGTLTDDPDFALRLAQIEIDLLALESLVLRALYAETAGKPPGPEASFLKIKGTEVQQGLTELLVEAVGPYAAPFQPEAFRQDNWNEEPVGPDYAPALAPLYFNWRKASIYGGSNEIQKNIIAKTVLGL
jgi:alkylation response protein AidB-like acyl-CoA dehydrogenase